MNEVSFEKQEMFKNQMSVLMAAKANWFFFFLNLKK